MTDYNVNFITLDEKANSNVVVVIDVLRAFTTAAVAFNKNVKKIIPVSLVEEAFRIRDQNPDYLIMGEVDGEPIEGFDLSNSPTDLLDRDLHDKIIVHRSTAGTQGVMRNLHAKHIFVTGFLNVQATINHILDLGEDNISIVMTGVRGSEHGDEDRACAEYISDSLNFCLKSNEFYIDRVRNSKAGKTFASGEVPYLPKIDLDFACQIDLFDFIMKIERGDEKPYLMKFK